MSETRIERRRWERIPASLLNGVAAALVSGPDSKLVNISRGGALFEVSTRLPVRSSVRVKLTQSGGDAIVAEGRVAWGKVASIADGRIHYQLAVAFDQPLPELPTVPAGSEPEAVVSLAPESSPKRDAGTAAAAPHGDEAARKLAAANADLACQAAVLESLASKLRDAEEQRAALRAQLENERRDWETERSGFVRQLADAVVTADTLQATLDTRDQQHSQALRDLEEQHAAVVSELVNNTNEQQAEFQRLLELATKVEGALRDEVEGYRTRLEATEARADALDARYRKLCREIEKLAALTTENSVPVVVEERIEEQDQEEPVHALLSTH